MATRLTPPIPPNLCVRKRCSNVGKAEMKREGDDQHPHPDASHGLQAFQWVGAKTVKGQMAKEKKKQQQKLGGGFKYFLFSSLFGEDSHFD